MLYTAPVGCLHLEYVNLGCYYVLCSEISPWCVQIVQITNKNIIWIYIEIMTQFNQLRFVFFTRLMMTQQ
jgi:hypothetical protein